MAKSKGGAPKAPKAEANQFKKGLARLKKVTIVKALARRFAQWELNDPAMSGILGEIRARLEHIETLREVTIQQMEGVGAYTPPAYTHTGELKLSFGRQVWLKSKFKDVYSAAYSDELLSSLHVLSVVNGRVVVLLGPFDVNNVESMPRAIMPKLHLTGAAS